jgi:hypothetical protein
MALLIIILTQGKMICFHQTLVLVSPCVVTFVLAHQQKSSPLISLYFMILISLFFKWPRHFSSFLNYLCWISQQHIHLPWCLLFIHATHILFIFRWWKVLCRWIAYKFLVAGYHCSQNYFLATTKFGWSNIKENRKQTIGYNHK